MRLDTLGMVLLLGACHAAARPVEIPPPLIMGEFEDDYGASYTITPREWRHGSSRYHIIEINTRAQYLIAQNDAGNPADPLLFTRIDWLPLSMPPYEWAFCMTAFNAVTVRAAKDTPPPRRDSPRAGCNNFPFSRMKRR